jgi:outer membrane usher protein FimD/PapC
VILLRALVALALLLAGGTAAWAAGDVRPAAAAMVAVDMPADFAGLAETQHVVADMMFGGRRVGQFEVEASPGRLRILHPEAVVAAIPGVLDPAALTAALTGPLDTNARYLCDPRADGCDRPRPDAAAIVFDPRRFVATIIVNPRLLVVRQLNADRYLAPDGTTPSLVDSVGGALAGGDGPRALYTVRNRAIVAFGAARLASEISYSSGQGASLDTLVGQLDRGEVRYTAGVTYAPGADLVGRRRIVGIGVASQFDTRTDHLSMTGTPLVVFLTQRSRVDLSTGGRLVSSHEYEAGNQTLDTSGLPDGSYPVEIRIQEVGGAARTEQRFFTKSAALPPPGRTLFFADAGLIAIDRPGSLIAVSRVPLATVGAARRLGAHFAWDATVMATDRTALAEIGGSWFTDAFQARAAVLGSSDGDTGALFTASSTNSGRLSYSIDLRHVDTHGRHPLIPLDTISNDAFSLSAQASTQQLDATSYSQLSATVSARIARAQVGLSAYWRHDAGQPTSYAIGPTLHLPLLERRRALLTFDGSYAETDRGRAVTVGLRFQLLGDRASLTASAGAQTGDTGDGRHLAALAAIGGSLQRDVLGGRMDASGLVQRGSDGTLVQGSVDQRGPTGYFAGTLTHRADGAASSTQYGLSMQSEVAATHGAVTFGARDQNDSAIVVRMDGGARSTRFEVLLDDARVGTVRPGGRLAISVAPYRRYTVRVRPIGGALVAFDTRPRIVDMFPGNVAALRWTAAPVLAMFGRLVHPDGSAVADADVSVPGGEIAATDGQGWFQLQAAGDAVLTARTGDGRSCRAVLSARATDKGYTALGTVPCRP